MFWPYINSSAAAPLLSPVLLIVSVYVLVFSQYVVYYLRQTRRTSPSST
jgi:hypothetical protein